MKTGLLWYDNDPQRRIEEKIRHAAQRYQEKFGRAPDICYVNPAMLAQVQEPVSHLQVVGKPNILPHHFLVGVADKGS
jgi:hypothetical protein